MKIQCLSRNGLPLKVTIRRDLEISTESKYSDSAEVKDVNSVVFVKGPIHERESLIIVSRDNGAEPYIASTGSKGSIAVEWQGNKVEVTLNSTPEVLADRNEYVRAMLDKAWNRVRGIYKGEEGRGKERKMMSLFVPLEEGEIPDFGGIQLDELVTYLETGSSIDISHYHLALTIEALFRARAFIAKNRITNNIYTVYSTMVGTYSIWRRVMRDK